MEKKNVRQEKRHNLLLFINAHSLVYSVNIAKVLYVYRSVRMIAATQIKPAAKKRPFEKVQFSERGN